MKRLLIALAGCILLSAFVLRGEEPQTVFKDGDRVCFIGNSITHGGAYWSFVMNFYVTRFPDRRIEFYNCGVSGDRASGILRRMERDILVHRPTVATLMTGMNDSNRSAIYGQERDAETRRRMEAEAFDAYKKDVGQITDILKAQVPTVILFTPTIYDQTAQLDLAPLTGTNEALQAYGRFVEKSARDNGFFLVDFWNFMERMNRRRQQADPAFTLTGADRVHPQGPGHLAMTYRFLTSTGVPGTVSEITVDARSGKTAAVNGTVSGCSVRKDEITLTHLAKALPYVIREDALPGLELVPFQEELNREMLTVTRLPEGRYDLLIDGAKAGTYSADELARGINLAGNSATPQYRQSEKVAELCETYRREYQQCRFINFVEMAWLDRRGLTGDVQQAKKYLREEILPKETGTFQRNCIEAYLKNKERYEEIMQEVYKKADAIYSVNKPRPHTYKLLRAN